MEVRSGWSHLFSLIRLFLSCFSRTTDSVFLCSGCVVPLSRKIVWGNNRMTE
jgi:hypothetical protein